MRPCHGQGVHGPEAKAKAAAAAERRKQKMKENRALKREEVTQFLLPKSNMLKHSCAAEGFVDGRSKAGRAAKFEAEVARTSRQEGTGCTRMRHASTEAALLPDSRLPPPRKKQGGITLKQRGMANNSVLRLMGLRFRHTM